MYFVFCLEGNGNRTRRVPVHLSVDLTQTISTYIDNYAKNLAFACLCKTSLPGQITIWPHFPMDWLDSTRYQGGSKQVGSSIVLPLTSRQLVENNIGIRSTSSWSLESGPTFTVACGRVLTSKRETTLGPGVRHDLSHLTDQYQDDQTSAKECFKRFERAPRPPGPCCVLLAANVL